MRKKGLGMRFSRQKLSKGKQLSGKKGRLARGKFRLGNVERREGSRWQGRFNDLKSSAIRKGSRVIKRMTEGTPLREEGGSSQN